MIISLILPEGGETVATYTFTDTFLAKLRARGIDLVAELPQVALSSNWEDSTLPFRLEAYLDKLVHSQKGSTHTVHVVKRELDLTDEDRKLLTTIPKRQFSFHEFAMVEYDEEVQEPVVEDLAVAQEKAEVSSLIAFLQRGMSEKDLLRNDLYPEQPLVEEIAPGPTPEVSQESLTEEAQELVAEKIHEFLAE